MTVRDSHGSSTTLCEDEVLDWGFRGILAGAASLSVSVTVQLSRFSSARGTRLGGVQRQSVDTTLNAHTIVKNI